MQELGFNLAGFFKKNISLIENIIQWISHKILGSAFTFQLQLIIVTF